MSTYLFASLVSFFVHFALIVPFIDFLYRMKFQRAKQKTIDAFDKPTPIFDKFHAHKAGVPVGGGILILVITSLLFVFFLFLTVAFGGDLTANFAARSEVILILFTFISFAFLGIYDDFNKVFFFRKQKFFGLKMRHKFIIELILATIISTWLFFSLKIDIIHIPFLGVFQLSYFYIFFAGFVIVAFANAVNITDGLDGLASGVLIIALLAFWTISRAIIDTPTSLFIAVWVGGLMAFLYFNVYPARIILGDSGALSFGATFAVIALILGKAFVLPIIGGVFVLTIASSMLQLLSKKFLKRKLFPVAPIHLYLQYRGWEEPRIVMRMWLAGILCAVFGLLIAFLK